MPVELSSEIYIKNLREDLRNKFKEGDDISMEFLEHFCHFIRPMNVFGLIENPDQLIYKTAQRDLLLTIKTLLDPRLTDKEVAAYYKILEE